MLAQFVPLSDICPGLFLLVFRIIPPWCSTPGIISGLWCSAQIQWLLTWRRSVHVMHMGTGTSHIAVILLCHLCPEGG